jgi:hypothetical protein
MSEIDRIHPNDRDLHSHRYYHIENHDDENLDVHRNANLNMHRGMSHQLLVFLHNRCGGSNALGKPKEFRNVQWFGNGETAN